MLAGAGLLGLLELGLVVFCLFEVLTTPADRVRLLPRLLWAVVVLLLPLVGPASWLLLGRPRGPEPVGAPARPAPQVSVAPDDDEEFLRRLRERTEEQRRRARDEQDPPEPHA